MKNNKFLSFFKKYSTILVCAIVIPSVITIGQYLFANDKEYHNDYYQGERLDIDDSKFELTAIKKIGKVSQSSSNYSYQGAACYKDKYVVCLDGLEAIQIYDSNSMKLLHHIDGAFNREWHCNQAFFGDQYYKMSDEYPLFYISMEHKNVHSTMAFRIYKRGGVYHIEQVQTIKLVFDVEEDTLYYPNSYFDFDEGLIYYSGYTESNYMRSDSNKLKYYSFPMPSYKEEYYEFHTSNPIDSFSLPSETATQGGFISHSHLYQTFSFGSKTDPLRAPVMRVVDLKNKTIIKEYNNLGEQFGVYTEFEHLAVNDKGKLISLGNPFDIYEFEYHG
ncbi:MAG: hypothetical protein J5666_07070 [Bacilli bacterium]|nr:hypothetical protein [Bacilli bacterium]